MESGPSESLKGRLLISSGGLYDPNFRHTVVVVGEHGPEGAVGVILNRPMEPTVDEVVPPLADLVPPGDPLYEGGPVAPDQAVILADVPVPGYVDIPVLGSVGFVTGEIPAAIRSVVRHARVFLGHAGWGPGQLEGELEEGSWILEDATPGDLFTSSPLTLWHDILKRKGPPYDTIAKIPFDPTMN